MNNTSSLSLSCCISISDTVSRHKILIRIWNRPGKGRGKVKTFCWDESFLKCINALKQRDEKWMDVNQRAKKDHQSCKVWLGPVVYIWVWVGSACCCWVAGFTGDLRLNASTKFIKETLSRGDTEQSPAEYSFCFKQESELRVFIGCWAAHGRMWHHHPLE